MNTTSKTVRNGMAASRSLEALRARKQRGCLSPQAIAVLDRVNPGWGDTQNERWHWTLTEVLAWFAEHHKLPRTSGKNLSDLERRLGKWLSHQRNKLPEDSERYRLLDWHFPGWNMTLDEVWERNLESTITWRDSNSSKNPRGGGHDLDDDERFAGQWLQVQRKRLKPEDRRYRILDERLPGWNITRDALWDLTLREVATWHDLNQKYPRRKGKNLTDLERRLGLWLGKQRERLEPGSERYRLLDEKLPGWKRTVNS